MQSTPLFFEAAFESANTYENPLWDMTASVAFRSDRGYEAAVDAYWDGGRTWRVRFGAPYAGHWTYRVTSTDSGLNGQSGEFTLETCAGQNTVYAHGPLSLSADRRRFTCADGTPWFFLADTAWNGVLKAKETDWEQYLAIRAQQGFSAVQFVMTQWRAFLEEGFTGTERIQIRPDFYRRLDGKFAAINRHGLIAVPVLLWACKPTDPGAWLPEEDAIRLSRYLIARYGAYQVIWMLGGDGNYRGEKAARWHRIGRALFANRRDRLVTTHPGGQMWVADEFRNEDWFDFLTYQSGHGDDARELRWLVQGPPSQEWTKEPPRPIINAEPNYEHHLAYQSKRRFTGHEVRRAAYWSLFLAPASGVTYGHHSIWPWMEEAGYPMDHPGSGMAPAWYEAVHSEGARSMTHMRTLMESLPWWKLLPAHELLAEQPGEEVPEHFIAVARTEDDSCVVAYLPVGGEVAIQADKYTSVRWFNPAAGTWQDASGKGGRFAAPSGEDWVLVLRR